MKSLAASILVTGVALLAAPGLYADEAGKWATIRGQVVFAKDLPIPKLVEIDVSANPDKEMCLKKGKVLSEEWVINAKNRGLKNVFVWIEPADAPRGKAFPQNLIHPKLAKPEKMEVEIDQPCCQFVPHALAARAGQTLIIKNSAPKAHNANWSSFSRMQGRIRCCRPESSMSSKTCSRIGPIARLPATFTHG
jgi:hypothetical protein